MTDLLHTWTPANHYALILALADQCASIDTTAGDIVRLAGEAA